jgi:hypothetical protein
VADLSERDEMTLHVLAILEGTTVAAQRRQAVRNYARRARESDDVGAIVSLILASRRERQGGGSNVVSLRGGRG